MNLKTTHHAGYEIPAAMVTAAELTTYLGVSGQQRTEAVLQLANAGMQFLEFRLPGGAELWSASVAGRQAKPGRLRQVYIHRE